MLKNRLAITNIENGKPAAPLVLRGEVGAAIADAAKYGYDALEIHVVDPYTFDCDAVNAKLKEHGIVIAAIVTGQMYVRRSLTFTSPDPSVRERAIAELKAYIDVAAKVNAADGIVIGWAKGNRPEGDASEFDALLVQGLRELGAYAVEKGQRVLLEVINRYEVNLLRTSAEMKEFLDKYDLPGVYYHMDTFHMNIEEADLYGSIMLCGDRLGYIHFADSNRLYPGAGHFDFPSVMRAIKDVGYTGSLSVECIPLPDSDTAARESYKNMKALMDI